LSLVLMHELIRLGRTTSATARPLRGGLPVWRQKRVVEFIEEHLAEEISLAALAGLVDLSLYHFARASASLPYGPPDGSRQEPVAEAGALGDADRHPDWLSRNEFIYDGIS
jgi:hypothetical protein